MGIVAESVMFGPREWIVVCALCIEMCAQFCHSEAKVRELKLTLPMRLDQKVRSVTRRQLLGRGQERAAKSEQSQKTQAVARKNAEVLTKKRSETAGKGREFNNKQMSKLKEAESKRNEKAGKRSAQLAAANAKEEHESDSKVKEKRAKHNAVNKKDQAEAVAK